MQGNRLFSLTLLLLADTRFDLATLPRRAVECGDPTEAVEQLVTLPKLAIDPARLATLRLPKLPADERFRSGVFSRASAIADNEAGSASGGEFCHLCMGLRLLSRRRLDRGIETGSLGVPCNWLLKY